MGWNIIAVVTKSDIEFLM